VRQSGAIFLAVLALSSGLLPPRALLLTAPLPAGAAPLSMVAILAVVAAVAVAVAAD
jgi:hypothetical protein